MKALVIAPQPFFTPRGTPFSVYYRTKAMAELGEEIDLLTYGQGHDIDIDHVRLIRTPPLSFLGKVRTGPSFLKVIHDVMILFYTLALLIRNRYDYVHAHEEAVFIAWILKPFFRFRLLYDMHSSLPEQLTNFSFTRSRLLIGLFEWAERRVLLLADAIIVVCPALLDKARSLARTPDNVVLIENSSFEEVALKVRNQPDAANNEIDEAKALARSGNPLVVYAGTLESYQGIDLLLESFSLLAKEYADLRLLIVGGDPKQVDIYREMAAGMGLSDRCLLSGNVSQKVASSCNEMAKMLMSPRRSGTNTPMKIYSQMASGVPIVATRIESHTQILNDDIAVLVAPDRQNMAQGMKTILEHHEAANQIAKNARKLFDEQYSRPVYVDKTRQVLGILSGQS
jgi:glycosyltransferase involved in cell wall biosynthesis